VALIGESASCKFDGAGAAQHGKDGGGGQCKAQSNMLGKLQHKVGNVSIVTVADAIARAGSPLLRPSGTLLGANIDGATPESDKAAAVALAGSSGLALLVLGDSGHSCGEWGDSSTLALPSDQPELLRRVLETGTPTVLVMVHGRPVSFGTDPSANAGGCASLLDIPT
jgi:hypothetical protein